MAISATGHATLRTTTGTQNLTVAGLGWTPKGIAIEVTWATSDGTLDDHAAILYAIADDSNNHFFHAYGSEHNVGVTDVIRRQWGSGTAKMPDVQGADNAIEFEFEFNSSGTNSGPISNGWQINVTTAPGVAFQVRYTLYGDELVSFTAFWQQLTAASHTITTGHPNHAIVFHTGCVNISGGDAYAYHSRGLVSWDGTTAYNAGLSFGQVAAATSNFGLRIHANTALGQTSVSALDWTMTASTFTSTSFDVDVTGTSGSDSIFGYAMELPTGWEARAVILNSPTTALSDWDYSGLTFTPKFWLMDASMMTAVNTIDQTGNAGSLGRALYDTSEQMFMGYVEEDASADADTSSLFNSTKFLSVYEHTAATEEFAITLSANPFTSTGFSIPAADISAANSTVRKWPALFIGTTAGTVEASAALTASSTVTAVGIRGRFGAQANTASVTLTSAAKKFGYGNAALTASVNISGSAAKLLYGAEALTASGVVGVTGLKQLYGASALTGTVTLTSTGLARRFGSTALTGDVSVVADSLRLRTGAATLTGQVSVTAASVGVFSGSVSLTPNATVTSNANFIGAGASALTAQVTQIVAGLRKVFGSEAVTASVDLSTAGLRRALGAASISGVVSVSGAARRIRYGDVPLTAEASVNASGNYIVASAGVDATAQSLLSLDARVKTIYWGLEADASGSWTEASAASGSWTEEEGVSGSWTEGPDF